MDLELVSFKVCPYVQRSVITLREKNVPFKVTYIELDNPPSWFKEASPLGKVPILRTNDGVLFESAVINEYVDEVTEGSLMPSDPWQKAQTRAWVEFGGNCLMDYYQASMAPDEATYNEHLANLQDKLARLNDKVAGPYFFGDELTLADCAFTPLLTRLQAFAEYAPGLHLAKYPKLNAWAETMAKRESVQGSIVPEWKDLLEQYVKKSNGYCAGLLATA